MTCSWNWIEGSVLRTLVIHPQGLTLIPSTHKTFHNCLYLHSQGIRHCLLVTTGTWHVLAIITGQTPTPKLNFILILRQQAHKENLFYIVESHPYLSFHRLHIWCSRRLGDCTRSSGPGNTGSSDQSAVVLGKLLGTQEEQYCWDNSSGLTYVITKLKVKMSHCSFSLLSLEGDESPV